MSKKYLSWSDKMMDPRWQKLRLEIMERDGFACRRCGAKDKTLHVHHSYYSWCHEPWDYPPESLITLCDDHHAELHENQPDILQRIAYLTADEYGGLIRLLRSPEALLAFVFDDDGALADLLARIPHTAAAAAGGKNTAQEGGES